MDYLQAERQLIQEFLENLEELPDVHAKLHREQSKIGSMRLDAELDLEVAGTSLRLLVEAKRSAYPRDLHQVIWQLRRAREEHKSQKELVLMLVAEYLSPGAKQLLKAEHIGYYESGGSLYLPAPGAYFYIDKPPAKAFERSVRSLFSGRRAQVLHALLIHHESWFGVHELAQLAKVSPATVSEVLSELERSEWLTSRGKGPQKERYLSEASTLLDAWAAQVKTSALPRLARYYVPGLKADGLLSRIGKEFGNSNIEYSVSYEAAAQRYAPFLTSVAQVRMRLLKAPESQAAISELGAKSVTEGSNLSIIDAESQGDFLFRERVNGVWLASPVQVYLDLLQGEGRSVEMAEHLRKEKICF